MILSTLDKSRKGGAYEQIPSLVLGQRWTPQLNSRNMMKVVLCVWIEPYIENDLSFCVWPVHTPTTSKEVLTLSASTSPLPYTGNKSCIVNTILSVMPKHTVYIDPCMGSAEVFFRKPRAEKEILNDYNGDLVNLFRVIQNNRDAEVSHTQLTGMFRHSDPAALMDEAEQAQLAELDDTVTVYRGVTTINSDNLLALSWTLDYETADWFARRFDEDGTVYKAQIDKEHIFALFNGRDESEVVLDPKYLKDITQAQEPMIPSS